MLMEFEDFDSAVSDIRAGASDIEIALEELKFLDTFQDDLAPYAAKIKQGLQLIAEANSQIPSLKAAMKHRIIEDW